MKRNLCAGFLAAALLTLPAFSDEVVDKTKQAAKKTGRVTKHAAKTTADKTEEVADKTWREAKKGAAVVGDKAEDAGHATVKGTKKAGRAVRDTVDRDKK